MPAFSGLCQLGCPAASVVWRQLAWGGASLSCSGTAEGKTRRGSAILARPPRTGALAVVPLELELRRGLSGQEPQGTGLDPILHIHMDVVIFFRSGDKSG